jgi:hypothetical protein
VEKNENPFFYDIGECVFNKPKFSTGTPDKQQLQVHYAQVTISKGKNSNTDLKLLQNFLPPD